MIERLKKDLYDLIEKPLVDAGCEIADLVISRYRNDFTLRLFIYAQGGASLEKCAEVSRLTGDLIDGTDLFKSGYTLEVSSPGLDRPLKELRDYKFRVGEEVSIQFADPARKKIRARIVATNGNLIEFQENDNSLSIDLAEIEQAKIVF